PAQPFEVWRARCLLDLERAELVGGRRDDLLRFLEVARQRPLGLGRVPRAVFHLARAIRDIGEAHRALRRRGAMAPLAAVWLEPVMRQEAPAVVGDEVNRVDQELKLRLAEEVVEVDAHPARLDAFTPAHDLALEFLAGLDVDAEQAVAVRAGTAAAAARLD